MARSTKASTAVLRLKERTQQAPYSMVSTGRWPFLFGSARKCGSTLNNSAHPWRLTTLFNLSIICTKPRHVRRVSSISPLKKKFSVVNPRPPKSLFYRTSLLHFSLSMIAAAISMALPAQAQDSKPQTEVARAAASQAAPTQTVEALKRIKNHR